MGLALLVLAWAERNRALLAFTRGFLAIMLASPDNNSAGPWPNHR
jgi:hypothetical protein